MIPVLGALTLFVFGAGTIPPAGESDVQVTIQGVVDQRESTRTVISPDGIRIDSGPVDSLGYRQPSSGRFVRWREGHGGVLVWSLRATVVHTGVSARFELTLDGTDARELRWAIGLDTDWSRRRAGKAIPSAGTALVRAAVLSGDSILFQLAMPVLDSQAGGLFQPSVRYAATLNGGTSIPRRAIEPTIPIAPRPTDVPGEFEPFAWPSGRLP